MSDLLRRIKRPHRTPAAEPARGSSALETAETHPEASPSLGGSSPAGEDLADQRPTALRRGRLRKRLRFLDRERELLLRDLGGLVYEIHRSGTSGDREHHRALVAGKVSRLAALDAELESGLAALGEARGDTVLREPGIGGLCPRCGEIHGSDARFCSACGFPLEVAGTPAAGARGGGGPSAAEAIVPATGAPAVVPPVIAPAVPSAVAPAEDATGPVTPPAAPTSTPGTAAAEEQATRISPPATVPAGSAARSDGVPGSEPRTR
jgi:hypothetical protein